MEERERTQRLTDAQCLELLRGADTARIAWCTTRGPVVIPVNIDVQDRRVLIRTSGASALAERVDSERVAVQVDAVDPRTHHGWSVLARGVAHVRMVPSGPGEPTPWPAGPHSALVDVVVDDIEGRWLPARQDLSAPGSTR